MFIKKFAAVLACCLIAVPAMAQEAAVKTAPAVKATTAVATAPAVATTLKKEATQVMLTKERVLEGNAFRTDSDKVAADVKVTLSADGKVIDSVKTDEKGNFSFANVAPGAYQILGSADGFVGSQNFDVVDFASPAIGSPCSVGMCGASSDVIYDSFESAPVSSFSSTCGACNACNTCGGGLGGGRIGGGRLGGRLGGGLLSNGRIGLIGLAGLAGLAGDDASPDL